MGLETVLLKLQLKGKILYISIANFLFRKKTMKKESSLDNREKLKAKREFFKNKMASWSRSSSRNRHSLKSSSKAKSKDKSDDSLQSAMWDLDEINDYLKDYEVNRKKIILLFEDVQLILTELGFIHSGGRQAMKKDPSININKERDLLDDLWVHIKGEIHGTV